MVCKASVTRSFQIFPDLNVEVRAIIFTLMMRIEIWSARVLVVGVGVGVARDIPLMNANLEQDRGVWARCMALVMTLIQEGTHHPFPLGQCHYYPLQSDRCNVDLLAFWLRQYEILIGSHCQKAEFDC